MQDRRSWVRGRGSRLPLLTVASISWCRRSGSTTTAIRSPSARVGAGSRPPEPGRGRRRVRRARGREPPHSRLPARGSHRTAGEDRVLPGRVVSRARASPSRRIWMRHTATPTARSSASSRASCSTRRVPSSSYHVTAQPPRVLPRPVPRPERVRPRDRGSHEQSALRCDARLRCGGRRASRTRHRMDLLAAGVRSGSGRRASADALRRDDSSRGSASRQPARRRRDPRCRAIPLPAPAADETLPGPAARVAPGATRRAARRGFAVGSRTSCTRRATWRLRRAVSDRRRHRHITCAAAEVGKGFVHTRAADRPDRARRRRRLRRPADTAIGFGGLHVASRQTMMSGGAVEKACRRPGRAGSARGHAVATSSRSRHRCAHLGAAGRRQRSTTHRLTHPLDATVRDASVVRMCRAPGRRRGGPDSPCAGRASRHRGKMSGGCQSLAGDQADRGRYRAAGRSGRHGGAHPRGGRVRNASFTDYLIPTRSTRLPSTRCDRGGRAGSGRSGRRAWGAADDLVDPAIVAGDPRRHRAECARVPVRPRDLCRAISPRRPGAMTPTADRRARYLLPAPARPHRRTRESRDRRAAGPRAWP